MNLQHDIHEGSFNNPSSMDQFGFSSHLPTGDYPSIDTMMTVSDLDNPYGEPSRFLGSVYNPTMASPTLAAPAHRSYQQHSAGRHHHGQGGYYNPHDQYAQKQPFRRQQYQPPNNYPPPQHPPRGFYGRGAQRQMNHGPYGYGNDPHGHYVTDPYGSPLPLPPYGNHPMYPPPSDMYHPPEQQVHLMHSPHPMHSPYSRGGNMGNPYRGADPSHRNYANNNNIPNPAVARPILEQNLKPDEVIYQVTV